MWSPLHFPVKPEDRSFEAWVYESLRQEVVFKIFFRELHGKSVGACPARRSRAEWAAQRIKGLSLCLKARSGTRCKPKRSANQDKSAVIKTLIHRIPISPQGTRHDVAEAPRRISRSSAPNADLGEEVVFASATPVEKMRSGLHPAASPPFKPSEPAIRRQPTSSSVSMPMQAS